MSVLALTVKVALIASAVRSYINVDETILTDWVKNITRAMLVIDMI